MGLTWGDGNSLLGQAGRVKAWKLLFSEFCLIWGRNEKHDKGDEQVSPASVNLQGRLKKAEHLDVGTE